MLIEQILKEKLKSRQKLRGLENKRKQSLKRRD
jgi:hypothetical protein